MVTTKLISKPPTGRFLFAWLFALACLAWSACSAMAQINISNVATVNITPGSFSVVWSGSSTGAASGTPSISVFADSAGLTSLAGQLGIEFFPLHTGNPALTNSYDRRIYRASLRQKTSRQGLVEVQVSGCAPNTTYYYQLQETDGMGHQTVWPVAGPLPAVTTAVANDFVVQSLQLVLDVPGLDPSGSIVILSDSNTPSLLAAVAGDGASSNQVYFNLSDMLAASGATNFLPLGNQQFTAIVLGASNAVSQTYSVNFTADFVVGSGSQSTLGSYAVLGIGSTISRAGDVGTLPITLNASAITNLSFILNLPTNRFSSLVVQSLSPQLNSATVLPVASNSLMITLASAPGQTLSGNQQIAQLNFTTFPNQSSAFVPFSPQSLGGANADSSSVSNLAVQAGRLVIVGNEPLLEATTGSQGARTLLLYGVPGDSYQIQSSANLASAGAWTDVRRVPMSNLVEVMTGLVTSSPSIFYRAYQFIAAQPILDPVANVGGLEELLLYGAPSSAYEVDYATSLSSPIAWHFLTQVTLANSFQYINGLSSSTPDVFYRAVPVPVTQPTLIAETPVGGRVMLQLSGAPGSAYEIDYTTSLNPPIAWHLLTRVGLTNSSQLITGLSTSISDIFYRCIVLNADPPVVEAHLDNQNRSLLVYGLTGTGYGLQYATNLSPTVTWLPVLNFTLTNSFQSISNLGGANPVIFYRVKR